MSSAGLAGNKFNGSEDEFREVIREMPDEYHNGTYHGQNNPHVRWEYRCSNNIGKIVWYKSGAIVFQGARLAHIKDAWFAAASRVHSDHSVVGTIHDQPALPSNAMNPTPLGVPHGTRAAEIRARLLALPGYTYNGHHLESARSEYIFRVGISSPVPAGLAELELTWYYNARSNRLVARVVDFRNFSQDARAAAIQAFYDAYEAANPDHALLLAVDDENSDDGDDDDDDTGGGGASPAAGAGGVGPVAGPGTAAAAAPIHPAGGDGSRVKSEFPRVKKEHGVKKEDEPFGQ